MRRLRSSVIDPGLMQIRILSGADVRGRCLGVWRRPPVKNRDRESTVCELEGGNYTEGSGSHDQGRWLMSFQCVQSGPWWSRLCAALCAASVTL